MMHNPMTTAHRIARKSGCDLRTVARFLAGLPIRRASAERIIRAAKTLGVELGPYVVAQAS